MKQSSKAQKGARHHFASTTVLPSRRTEDATSRSAQHASQCAFWLNEAHPGRADNFASNLPVMPSPMSARLKGTMSLLSEARALLMPRDPPAWTADIRPTMRWGGNLLQAQNACAGAVGPALVCPPRAPPLPALEWAARRSMRVTWATCRRASCVARPRRCSIAEQTCQSCVPDPPTETAIFGKSELATPWDSDDDGIVG